MEAPIWLPVQNPHWASSEEHHLKFATEDGKDPFVFRGERMGHALGR
jgi:hypothetical protein